MQNKTLTSPPAWPVNFMASSASMEPSICSVRVFIDLALKIVSFFQVKGLLVSPEMLLLAAMPSKFSPVAYQWLTVCATSASDRVRPLAYPTRSLLQLAALQAASMKIRASDQNPKNPGQRDSRTCLGLQILICKRQWGRYTTTLQRPVRLFDLDLQDLTILRNQDVKSQLSQTMV